MDEPHSASADAAHIQRSASLLPEMRAPTGMKLTARLLLPGRADSGGSSKRSATEGTALMGPQTCLPPMKLSMRSFTSGGRLSATRASGTPKRCPERRRTHNSQVQSWAFRISRTIACQGAGCEGCTELLRRNGASSAKCEAAQSHFLKSLRDAWGPQLQKRRWASCTAALLGRYYYYSYYSDYSYYNCYYY